MQKGVLALVVMLVLGSYCQDFNAYVARFHKVYQDADERARRQAIYLENWLKIHEHNQANRGYLLSENQFTDRTLDEQKVLSGVANKLIIPDIPSVGYPKKMLKSSLAAEIDWRTSVNKPNSAVTPARDQGTCGSCWAFTTVALYESFLMVGGMSEPDLSEEYILECTTANSPSQTVSSCAGGILQYSIPFAVSTGIPTETAFPYAAYNFGSANATPSTPNICSPTNTYIKDNTLNGSYNQAYRNLTNDQMKDLISYAPIAVAMYINETSDIYSYSGGVYTGCPAVFDDSVARINHAVVVVGYDASGNYIIKNSWGSAWGENGFGIISKDRDCGISYWPLEIRGSNAKLLSTAEEQAQKLLVFTFLLVIALFLGL